MAINNYTGLQGSGKTYEVTSTVILDALLVGRRVVTNIAGIDQEAIFDYLEKFRAGDVSKFGSVVKVSNDDVASDTFFPDEHKPDIVSIVRPGDLVAIDECWRFWSSDDKLSENHMQFFRMHRHYVDTASGMTCDLVLMIQDVMTLHRKLRAVVELTTRTVKLKSLGLNNRYRIEIYDGNKISTKTKIDTFQKKYNPAIFPLYQSYGAAGAVERSIDSRQNILANARFWIIVASVFLIVFLSMFFVKRFFTPPKSASVNSESSKLPVVAASSTVNSTAQPTQPSVVLGSRSAMVPISDQWRYSGELAGADGSRWVVLVNTTGRLRLESPSMFRLSGLLATGEVDGTVVNNWSGSLPLTSSANVVGSASSYSASGLSPGAPGSVVIPPVEFGK